MSNNKEVLRELANMCKNLGERYKAVDLKGAEHIWFIEDTLLQLANESNDLEKFRRDVEIKELTK